MKKSHEKIFFIIIVLLLIAITCYSALAYDSSDVVEYFNGSDYVTINTSIVSSSGYYNYNYEMTSSFYKVFFRNNTNTGGTITTAPVRFEKDGYVFTYDISGGGLQWTNAPVNPGQVKSLGNTLDTQINVSGNKAVYVNGYTNTNVEYEVQNDMLKETLILKSLVIEDYAFLEYSGNIKFNRSLTICTEEKCFVPSGSQDDFNTSGKIYFRDANNVTIFYLSEPNITDANGSSTLGTYFVRGSDAQMNFDLRINKTFLANASYPVMIDPSVKSAVKTKSTPAFLYSVVDFDNACSYYSLNITEGSNDVLRSLGVNSYKEDKGLLKSGRVEFLTNKTTFYNVSNTYLNESFIQKLINNFSENESLGTLYCPQGISFNETHCVYNNTIPNGTSELNRTDEAWAELKNLTFNNNNVNSESKLSRSDASLINKSEVQFRICGRYTPVNGRVAIDHIPVIEGIKHPEWAWWNASYDTKILINCSEMTVGDIMLINGSAGFNLGSGQQLVWTNCQENLSVYYFSTNTSIWAIANDTSSVNWKTITGNNSGNNPTTIFSNPNLISYFGFDENSTTSILSSSTAKYNATGWKSTIHPGNTTAIVGNSIHTNKSGQATVGTSLNVTNMADVDILGNFTHCGFYYEDTAWNDVSWIGMWWKAGNDYVNGIGVLYSTSSSFFNFYSGSATYRARVSSVTLPLNCWNYVCFVYNTTHFSVYINGTLRGTPAAYASNNLSDTSPLPQEYGPMGVTSGSGYNWWNGYLDEVSFWNSTKSTSEINNSYQNYKATVPVGFGSLGNLECLANVNISTCSVLSCANTIYNLTADITDSAAAPNCMDITANNVTLDCQGHTIDGTDTASTYGVIISRASATNTNAVIKNCVITDWEGGLYTYYAKNNTFTNNTANSNTYYGISLDSSSNNTIANSTANLNDYGIFLVSNSNNNIIANSTANSNYYGIYLLSSSNNNTIANSTANSNNYGIVLDSNSNNNTIANSTANSNNYGIYLFFDSNNNIIANSTANLNTYYGIHLEASSNNIIANSTANSNYDLGISLSTSSNNNTIINSTANSNTYIGIFIFFSSNNNIIANSTANSNSDYGIQLRLNSNNNIIANSTANSNNYGIYLLSSSNNTIYSNTIKGSSSSGVYLSDAGNNGPNTFYNNFLNNTNNTKFAGTVYLNYWNITNQAGTRIFSSGTNISGNYWTNSSGTGYSDTCTDADTDGFCDSPYNVTTGTACTGATCGNNTDYLPLSKDIISPVYSLNSTNSTLAGTSISHNLYWTDDIGLSGYIFSYYSGIWSSSLTGWQYRKNHTIINATGADVNYQTKIIVINATGADSGNTVYINKTNSDFGDIRFTNSNGSLLDYWMESVNNYINATFWVEISENLTSTNQTIYIYYGNSTATTTSNGSNTFDFFDDFANANQWTEAGGAWSVASSEYSGIGNPHYSYTTAYTFTNGVIEAKQKVVAGTYYYGILFRYTNTANYYGLIQPGGNERDYIIKKVSNSVTETTYSAQYASDGLYHRIKGIIYGNSLAYYKDESLVTPQSGSNPASDSTFSSGALALGGGATANGNTVTDWIFVRKYAASEPVHDLWGSEELVWVNDSWVAMGGTTNWSNVSKTVTSIVGANIAWCVYTNDSSNNWNSTSCITPFNYTTTTDCLANVNISTCSVLSCANTIYNLTADITDSAAAPNCMDITADNVTLDCQGHTIDGKDTASTSGVSISRASATNTNAVIKNCVITDWTYGLYTSYAQNNTFTNNTANSNNRGISLDSSSNNIIANSTANSNLYGIYLTSSSNNNIIANSTANSNTNHGIFLSSSSNNNIIANSTANSNNYGIYLTSSSNNNVTGSNLINNSPFDFYVSSASAANCNNVLTNVNGTDNKPIVYYNNTAANIDGWNNNVSEIVLCGATNSVINNVNISRITKKSTGILLSYTTYANITKTNINNSYNGIYLFSSSNNIIANSTANLNNVGIYLTSNSNNNIIANSTANLNTYYYGIFLSSSSNNNIIANSTANSNLYGIYLTSSSNNTIANSTANSNAYGIYLTSSSNNTIYSNTVKGSSSYGFFMESAGPNTFYNNFLNNTNNTKFSATVYPNYWNTTNQAGTRIFSSGTNISGNYWTNSSGTGYSDTCTDADTDGFCDSPYNVTTGTACTAGVDCGNNTDYLPLSNKYADIISPVYSLNSTNSTLAGSSIMHRLYWTDSGSLSGFIFSWCNDTLGNYSYDWSSADLESGIEKFNTSSGTINNTYNWTSADQEAGIQQFNTSATADIVGLNKTYNMSDGTNGNKAYWASPAGTSRWLMTNQASAAQYTNLSTPNAAYAKVAPDTDRDEPFWRFNFTIAETVLSITKINVNWRGYDNATATGTCYSFNFTNSAWISMGATPAANGWLNASYTTYLSARLNGTDGAKQLVVACEGANYRTASGDTIFVDYVESIIFYNSTGYTAAAEENSTAVEYASIGGSDYQTVTSVKSIITIDSYNPTASNTTYANNNRPDIQVAFYNGTGYGAYSDCNINDSMGNDALNTAEWNCTISASGAAAIAAWNNSANRKIQIRSINMDAYNNLIVDEINVSAVYLNVSGYNITTEVVAEQNSTATEYSAGGSDYQKVTAVKSIITIDSYNPTASNTTYANNNRPDIQVAFYNGTAYGAYSNCNINASMGNNALNTADWNCTITATTSVTAWNSSANRKIQIRAINLDAYNTAIYDEINVSAVYLNVSGYNISGVNCSEADAPMVNDSWVAFGNGWSNVSKIVSSTVGATIKWCVYANDTSNNWNSTSCITPFQYITTSSEVDVSFILTLPTGCSYLKGCTSGAACSDCTRAYFNINLTPLNFTPEGQNDATPFFEFTNTGTVNLNWTMKLNTTLSKFEVKYDTDNSIVGAHLMSTSFSLISSGIVPAGSVSVWLWTNSTNTITVADTASALANSTSEQT